MQRARAREHQLAEQAADVGLLEAEEIDRLQRLLTGTTAATAAAAAAAQGREAALTAQVSVLEQRIAGP